MADTAPLSVTIRPGHVVTGRSLGESPTATSPWSYDCSCGEVTGSTRGEMQTHVDEVRGG